MGSLERRLASLESATSPQGRLSDAKFHFEYEVKRLAREYSQFIVGWELLAPTMEPEHRAIVEAKVPDWWRWQSHRGRAWLTFRGDTSEMSPLTFHVWRMIAYAASGKHTGPFVLPRVVAQVFIDDPLASVSDERGRCGYGVPDHSGWSSVRGGHGGVRIDEQRDYFTSCPLCGGQVGCLMYYRTHDGVFAPTFRLPHDRLDTVYAEALAYFQTIETEYYFEEKEAS